MDTVVNSTKMDEVRRPVAARIQRAIMFRVENMLYTRNMINVVRLMARNY